MRVKFEFYEDQHRQLLGESNRKWKRVENIRSTQFWPSLYGWSSREPDEKGQQLFFNKVRPSLLKTIKGPEYVWNIFSRSLKKTCHQRKLRQTKRLLFKFWVTKLTVTLESGINVALRLLIFGNFSRGYGLITDLKDLNFTT